MSRWNKRKCVIYCLKALSLLQRLSRKRRTNLRSHSKKKQTKKPGTFFSKDTRTVGNKRTNCARRAYRRLTKPNVSTQSCSNVHFTFRSNIISLGLAVADVWGIFCPHWILEISLSFVFMVVAFRFFFFLILKLHPWAKQNIPLQ